MNVDTMNIEDRTQGTFKHTKK